MFSFDNNIRINSYKQIEASIRNATGNSTLLPHCNAHNSFGDNKSNEFAHIRRYSCVRIQPMLLEGTCVPYCAEIRLILLWTIRIDAFAILIDLY